MATSTFILFVLLLILAATQGCFGEEKRSLNHRDAAMVTAMRQVSSALQCFGDTTQKSLHLQKLSNDALNALPEMMLQVSQELHKHSQCENSLKQVVGLTQENKDLKSQLENKNKEVQILNNTLGEYVLRVQQLEGQLKIVNNTADPEATCMEIVPEHLEEIKPMVEVFINNRNFRVLERDLCDLLGENSLVCKQLERLGDLWSIGVYSYSHLALLLMSAGLPADTPDASKDTMLQGAAVVGQMHMVKLLLDNGADVNLKGWGGYTPLMRAAYGGNHLEVVQCLVQAGADTTAKDYWGHNALYYAKLGCHTAVVHYLEQFPH